MVNRGENRIKISAIITAGGTSSRYGNTNKLLETVNSKKVIEHTVDAFLKIEEISEILICANISIIDDLKKIFSNKRVKVVEGGKTRQESVFNGLKACSKTDYVLIHDGARPMISVDTIKKAIDMVQLKKALTVAAKTIDTIKKVDGNLKIITTIDRTFLYNTQTPQAFEYNLILNAHEQLQGKNYTDDAGMLEELGCEVYILEGEYKNIKITTKNDLDLAKVYLN